MDWQIRFEYATSLLVDGNIFEAGKKKLRIKNIRIGVDGGLRHASSF